MQTDNPYLAVENLGRLQRQAGVDPEVAELVCAYARLQADAGEPMEFGPAEPKAEAGAGSFIHRWLLERNRAADPRFLEFLVRYGDALAARKRPVIYSVGHLAQKRRVTEPHLRWMAHNPRRFYREFAIPKADGRSRSILAPKGQLLTIQRWILRAILNRGKVHPYATGFVRGRSILDNARPHIGREVVIRIDLKDFFPSITHAQVRKVFQDFGYPYRVAVLLASLCTVDGRLPQGAPTSPALSNLVCETLDRRFAGLKKKLGFRYSRYADDLVFSSDNPRLPKLIPFFRQVLREEGLTVNESKVKVMRQSRRQMVTGVVVNRKPNVSREKARRLRAALHRLAKAGPGAVEMESAAGREKDPVYVLRGHVSFMQMLNRPAGARLAAALERAGPTPA